MSNNTKTLRQAAVELLQELGPQHYQKLTDEILSRGIATSSSKTACANDPCRRRACRRAHRDGTRRLTRRR